LHLAITFQHADKGSYLVPARPDVVGLSDGVLTLNPGVSTTRTI